MSAYQLTGEPEDISTAVIEAAYERIRQYPCDRRPARVAANLLNDTRQTLWRAASRERRLGLAIEPLTEEVLEHLAERPAEPSATDELIDLVAEAACLGQIQPAGARVILLTRVLDVPIDDLANEMELKAQTLRKRRQGAEAALAVMGLVA